MLNKLTPENFQKLSDDILRIDFPSSVVLKGVVYLIFEKSLDEPKYSSMYAQLCKRLSEEAPNFEPSDSACTFRLHLLNRCRIEFENRVAAVDAHDSNEIQNEDEVERRQFAKRKMLGNIKFIGELGKLEILSETILHRCIQQLLSHRSDDASEDLECLCQIMRTCGRLLDNDQGQGLMEQYFQRMKNFTDYHELSPRIRFMLKDVIDLREGNWVPRKAAVVEGPVPINQIRPLEDDHVGGYRGRDRNQHDRDTERSNNMSELFRHPMKTRNDMLSMGINLSSSPNLIPTTPFGANGFGSQRDGSFRGHNNQRSGYNNYTSQRGQYKHNQNNTNSQYNNQLNKDLAPRFKKNLILPKEEIGDVELRPNSMLYQKASVKSNNIMNNNRTIEPSFTQSLKQTLPTPILKEPLSIKQLTVEKPKQSKKDKGPTKDEVLKKFTALLDEYWKGELDVKQASNLYKEHKIPDKFAKDALLNGLTSAWDKTDVEQEKLIKLLANLKEENILNSNIFQETFKALCYLLDERDNEIDKAIDATAIILSSGICENLLTLNDVATLTDNGVHYPLFIVLLQQLHKKCGHNELLDMFNKCKINLLTQLPETDKTKERLSEILEERDLTFLYPLLRIQGELARQLQLDPNPQSYYKWIKDNLDQSMFNDPGFINALMTVLLKYITKEAAEGSGNIDDKAVAEKEKSMLERYQYILRSFLCEKLNLQLVAVYSLQVHFYSLGFPRGQLLRWFLALYDLEIIDEEAFLNWKEDVTDAYPGKGQALFQVNSWLTWLQEAESEEEEGEE